MILRLINYRGEEQSFDIGDIEMIASIDIKILAGDEVATVRYKGGDREYYDSDTVGRYSWAPFDGEYTIYDCECDKEDNLLFDESWLERDDSYEGMYGSF